MVNNDDRYLPRIIFGLAIGRPVPFLVGTAKTASPVRMYERLSWL